LLQLAYSHSMKTETETGKMGKSAFEVWDYARKHNLNKEERKALYIKEGIIVKKAKFDINDPDLYENSKPELTERTRARLVEMAELGMHETGVASFGIEGVFSGLYIEKVWSYSDEDFKGYLDWVKSLIEEKRE